MTSQSTLALLAPTLGLLGVFVGAWFARNRENEKARRDRITECYAQFIEAQSAGSRPEFIEAFEKRLKQQPLSHEEEKLISDIAEIHNIAHANLLLYGSPKVIKSLSEYFEIVDGLKSERGRKAYTALIQEMRSDSNAKNYPDFEKHLDNIIITGPEERRRLLTQQMNQGPQ